MRLACGLVLLAGAGLLLSGCTSSPTPLPSPPRSAPAASTPATTSAPAEPLPVPARLPGEVARTVVSEDLNSITSGDFPKGTRRFSLHLRCTGPVGSVMHYELLHGDGSRFGPAGDWNCDRTPGLIQESSATPPAGGVQIQVQADPGVTTAWAICSTSAKDK